MSSYIGVDIGGSKIAAGVIRGGRVLRKTTLETPARRKELVDSVISAVSQFYTAEVKGIGIGAAGAVDKKGRWLESPNIPCVNDISLKSMIEKRFRTRVEVNNDANCFALEEAVRGHGKNKSVVFGLILGTGTGGGIVIDRKIMGGADMLAGEVGMMPYLDSHFEMFCSGRFIKRMAEKNGMRGSHPKDVAELAEKGNQKAKRIYNEFGKHVGLLISNIICVVNPGIVVLGGGLSNSYPLFSASMRKAMKENLIFSRSSRTPVKAFSTGDYGIIGAALLVSPAKSG